MSKHMSRGIRFAAGAAILVLMALIVGRAMSQPSEAAAAVREAPPLPPVFWVVLAAPVLALLMAYVFYRGVMKEDEGTEQMRSIAAAVREGAYAYLRQ
ncbi:MAG TPA: hypothetical protein VMW52_03075, partial [Phycisphaerae bacterium]|nr:hypothetical protein [Phycisphaerae bacterium]